MSTFAKRCPAARYSTALNPYVFQLITDDLPAIGRYSSGLKRSLSFLTMGFVGGDIVLLEQRIEPGTGEPGSLLRTIGAARPHLADQGGQRHPGRGWHHPHRGSDRCRSGCRCVEAAMGDQPLSPSPGDAPGEPGVNPGRDIPGFIRAKAPTGNI